MSFGKLSRYSLTALLLVSLFGTAQAQEAVAIKVEKLLETEQSWDGEKYLAYPTGTPQLTMLKITIPPNSNLPWHEHAIPNAGYLLSGVLMVEKRSNKETRKLVAGDAIAEMVDETHRGYTGSEGATVLVFYAGKKGIPLSTPVK